MACADDPTAFVTELAYTMYEWTFKTKIERWTGDVMDGLSDNEYDYNIDMDNDTVDKDNKRIADSTYEWIADCATTSHICNARDMFTDYISYETGHPVTGVGNMTVHAEGRGTVQLLSVCQG